MANSGDVRINQILDGDNFVATRGVWIKGLSFYSSVDQETITKVKAINETKKVDLVKAIINLNIKSELNLDID